MSESAELPDQPATDVPASEAEAVTWRRFDVEQETSEALAAAQAAIAEGQCIVLPTDTVYGIGANAFSASAVQGLLDAKRRGRDMPPPVLVAETGMLEALAEDLPSHALRLAEAFWPGALTLIVPAQQHLRMDLGETRGTIAVRVPDHDFTRDLLRRTGPLAVSSANVSGQDASTSIDEAIEQLGNSVPVYLDAGATPGNTPSTIIDFVTESLGKVVRMGALSIERLREVDPFLVWDDEPSDDRPKDDQPIDDDGVAASENPGS
ncbi:L-threonylcarbamoyladenylate synthase [Luteococcus sp. H138]|uniref:L-threonylcarbamoyladenylate synthase n=1 Tax=unclassified Luteococcus TaxID=2639923 RepID=UPI00313DBDAB